MLWFYLILRIDQFFIYPLSSILQILRSATKEERNMNTDMINSKKIIDDYLGLADWRVKENSTVSYSLGGLILSNSGAMIANYWLNDVYTKEIADAHKSGDFHIHDLSML